MFPSRILAQVAIFFVLILRANADSHSIQFINQCGYGYPQLMYNGNNILVGDVYTNATYSGIAFLQTGPCGRNGENCTLLETTLNNPTCEGCGSTTDISLIQPHELNVVTSFSYYGACDGVGKMCTSENCGTDNAFFGSTDYSAQAYCEIDNVNLLIAFCANASEIVLSGGVTSGSSPTSPLPTSTVPTPSSIPSLGSSTPGSVPPVTPSTPSATPTETGCDETEPPTPSSTPTPTDIPSESATSAPTSTPTSTPTIPTNSAPPSGSASPTQRCRPRTTSLTPSNSAPTSPAGTPTTTPSLPPASTTPPAQRRHHRRTNHIRL